MPENNKKKWYSTMATTEAQTSVAANELLLFTVEIQSRSRLFRSSRAHAYADTGKVHDKSNN